MAACAPDNRKGRVIRPLRGTTGRMDKNCPVYRNIDLVSKKWTWLILLELYKNSRSTKRYSELKHNLNPITSKMLATRLVELKRLDMVRREAGEGNVPKICEYSLTRKGEDFVSVIIEMKRWGLRWGSKNRECERGSCKGCSLDMGRNG